MKGRRKPWNRTSKSWGRPPEGAPWTWLTKEVLSSSLWAALSISSRRVLDALMVELMSNAGRENGNLAVTYLQLEAFGVTKADIRKALLELQICCFVRLTHQGLRVAGGGDPSRYALTWFDTHIRTPNAAMRTDAWRDVLIHLNEQGITSVRDVRRWLKLEVAREVRPRRTRAGQQRAGQQRAERQRAGHQDIEGTPHVMGDERLHVMVETSAEVIHLTPHVRGGTGST